MKVTLIQSRLFWEDRKQNLSHFDQLVSSLTDKTDLIVLPEMFTTGFTMNPEKQAEPANGESLEWLKKTAKAKNVVITGSVAVEENGKYFNRLLWVTPDGVVKKYDKRHLFRLAKEDQHYVPGSERIIVKIGDWKICPLVCYDLRFPVWSRNRFTMGSGQWAVGSGQEPVGSGQSAIGSRQLGNWDYDVLIYVANWPEVRIYAWKQLLIARAIENQCYVIGVNRVGKDGNGFDHPGDSVVLNPKGEIMSSLQPNVEGIETVSLDMNFLAEYRKTFPVGLDADQFQIGS